MAGEKEPMGASMVNNAPAVRVLLVDDNSTSLSTTIPMLELFNYQVVVAKTPLEATSILHLNHESFDLILSDLQLSMINALDLQKQVEDEFHIPVILMCTNDSTNIPKRSLNVGRPLFIEKPPTPDDLKTIKQYVISRKKETQSLNYLKRRLLEEDDEERFGEEDYASLNPKKPKLTWTTALHNKFLEAIDAIGLDRAVPKKILEYMNVPGLTRVNIASHLQKYRIYLRRISEASGSMKHGMPDNLNESPFRSTFFWSQLHTLASNNLLLNYANSSNLETQVQGAPVSQINTSDHGEDNSNVPLVLNHPLTGLEGLSTQLGTKLNPQLNILESSYVISPSNNFTNYTTTQDNGNPSNGNQGDFGGLFDFANDMDYNEFMGLLEEGNQGDMSCFFNDDGFKLANNMVINSNIQQGTLNTDQIVENPLVEQAEIMPTSDNINQVNEDYFVEQAHQDVITMPTLKNNDQIVENAFVEPAAVAMSNLDNVFYQQILPIENPNNVLPPQNMLAIGQEVQNFDLPNIASPVLFQDWASNNFDEFSLYGIDDLVSFLSTCDENNASNNQLP